MGGANAVFDLSMEEVSSRLQRLRHIVAYSSRKSALNPVSFSEIDDQIAAEPKVGYVAGHFNDAFDRSTADICPKIPARLELR